MTFECKSPVFCIQKSSLNISKHLCFSNDKCLFSSWGEVRRGGKVHFSTYYNLHYALKIVNSLSK